MRTIGRLFSDVGVRQLAAGTVGLFALQVAGAAAGLGFHILVARQLGASGAGTYYLGLAVAMLAALGARLGMDNALLRFVAAACDRGDWPTVRGACRVACGLGAVSSSLLTVAVFFGADWLAGGLLGKPEIAATVRVMAFSIVPFTLSCLQAAALKAVGAGRAATVVQVVAVPCVALAVFAAMSVAGDTLAPVAAARAYVVATVVVCAGATVRLAIMLRQGARGTARFSVRVLLRTSLPLLLVASLSAAMAPVTTFLLGAWLPVAAVGLYGVAQRCATLMALVYTAVSTIAAPQFAALYARGDLGQLGAVARRVAFVAALVAVPLLVVFIPWGGLVLAIFGPEFSGAAVALTILAVGQYVAIVTGNAVDLLMMTGHEKTLRDIVAGTTVAYLLLIFLLVPHYGIAGAALARAGHLAATGLAAAVHVTLRIGVNLVPGPLRRRGAAG